MHNIDLDKYREVTGNPDATLEEANEHYRKYAEDKLKAHLTQVLNHKVS